MTINATIPQGTQLKYVQSAIDSVNLKKRFSAAILLVASAILQDSTSSSQLLKISKSVANDSSALLLLTVQAIQFSITIGAVVANKNTLSNDAQETFDDSSVSDESIMAVVLAIAEQPALLTTLGYED